MGRRFTSVIGRLGIPTGDGRIISPGGLTSRDLPLPLSWQRESGDGHGGSVVVARMEELEFHQDMVVATGHMLDVPGAWEAEELIEAGVIGPSMDLDNMTYVADDMDRVVITSARVAGATLVSIPAFAEVSITLDPLPVPDMERVESAEDMAWLSASAAVVSRETTLPPLEWFAKPDWDRPTPLVVSDTGRVYGHIAQWGVCHIGLPGCTTAPHSSTGYAHFLTKEQQTASGEIIPVGVLTAGHGHCDPEFGIRPAQDHYDNPEFAVAKVFAGEDEFGIWVAGWTVPWAQPERVQMLRDLDVSGDWRRTGGSLELIAACAVNTGGFPQRRVHFSLERGGQTTLIGQFKVTPATVEPGGVSRETLTDDARARWAWATREA